MTSRRGLGLGRARAARHGDLRGQLDEVGQELVERRVEEAHHDGKPVHGPQDAGELGPASSSIMSERPRGATSVTTRSTSSRRGPEQHVLGPAQADALGAEPSRQACVGVGLGVRAHAEHSPAVRVAEQRLTAWTSASVLVVGSSLAGRRHTELGRAVEARRGRRLPVVPSTETTSPSRRSRRRPRCRRAGFGVDLQTDDGGDAGAPEPPGDDRRMGGEPTARGDDRVGGDDPRQVVGHVSARTRTEPRPGARATASAASNTTGPDGRAGAGGQPGRQDLDACDGVELRVKQGLELMTVDATQGFVESDQTLVSEVGRDLEGRCGAALADPGLQQPQASVLDSELDVAQVAVVLLQGDEVLQRLAVEARVRAASSMRGMVVPGCR